MAWTTTPDIHRFVGAAGEFLATRPVEHTLLLTEAAYLAARSPTADGGLYGWWRDDTGGVAGAFVQAPRHPPVLSCLPIDAIDGLVAVLPDPTRIGVDARLVEAVITTWQRHGLEIESQSRITLYRLRNLRRPLLPFGRSRIAGPSDRTVLVTWYERLMAAFPDDASDVEYVVDDPLGYGGITLWEVDGEPVAMAGHSRVVCGMARLSAVYETEPGRGWDTAALIAACEKARGLAGDVLVFAAADDPASAGRYRGLGFEPVLDRVQLAGG